MSTNDPNATGATPGALNGPENCHEPPPSANDPADGRSRADDALASALAAGATVADAAEAAGVSERTAYRRLKDDEFAGRVRELRATFVAAAAGRLASSMCAASDTLSQLLTSENESVRLRAADRIVELGLKVTELADLQRRVEELERQAREAGSGS